MCHKCEKAIEGKHWQVSITDGNSDAVSVELCGHCIKPIARIIIDAVKP